jgi:hypothetical protein
MLAASAITVVLSAGCDGGNSTPKALVDGTPAAPPGVELQGVQGPAVMTKVRVVPVSRVRPGSRAATCLRRITGAGEPSGSVVERVGVAGGSVTVRAGPWLHACDNTPGARGAERHSCGISSGRLYGGRLRDPRLDIAGCASVDGAPMGFAWVDASRRAHYVVVQQRGYAEVYEVAAGFPIRIATTTSVSLEDSSAAFDLREHDADGNLIRRYELEAFVAG